MSDAGSAHGVDRRGFLKGFVGAGTALGFVGAWGLPTQAFASEAECGRVARAFCALRDVWLNQVTYSKESTHSKLVVLYAIVASPLYQTEHKYFDAAIASGPRAKYAHVGGWARDLLAAAAVDSPRGHEDKVVASFLGFVWATSGGTVRDEAFHSALRKEHDDAVKAFDGKGLARQWIERAKRFERQAKKLRAMKHAQARLLVGSDVEGVVGKAQQQFSERIAVAREAVEVLAWQVADGNLLWDDVLDDSCLHISNTTHVHLPSGTGECEGESPKGNNGVGNGEDPQPPGNPPVNDGPGTSPGNPGNQGGSKK